MLTIPPEILFSLEQVMFK